MSFRNGFMTNREFTNFSHDSSSKNFPYQESYSADSSACFRQQLKADLTKKLKRKSELFKQYDTYLKDYLPEYKNFILQEYSDLKKHFPEVNFELKLRIKSRDSYEKKVVRKLSEGRRGNIYDIFGSKIIIYGIEDTSTIPLTMIRDENALIKKCYEMYNYLLQKEDTQVKETRDYIKKSKSSGYRSLHLLRELNTSSHSFLSEVQIKTFQMHEKEEFGSYGHRTYKNRNLLLTQNDRPIKDCVPHYLQVYENPVKGKLSIYQKPFSDCFQEFFNIPLKDYLEQKEKANRRDSKMKK